MNDARKRLAAKIADRISGWLASWMTGKERDLIDAITEVLTAEALEENARLRKLVEAFRCILRHKDIRPPMDAGVQESLEKQCRAALESPSTQRLAERIACPKCGGLGRILVPIPQCTPPRDMANDCPECEGEGYVEVLEQEQAE